MLTCLARYALLPIFAITAACDSAAPVADDAAAAPSGEVLEGSISDAMLPLEKLSSQPPVAAPLPGETVTEAAAPLGNPATVSPPAAPDGTDTATAADPALSAGVPNETE